MERLRLPGNGLTWVSHGGPARRGVLPAALGRAAALALLAAAAFAAAPEAAEAQAADPIWTATLTVGSSGGGNPRLGWSFSDLYGSITSDRITHPSASRTIEEVDLFSGRLWIRYAFSPSGSATGDYKLCVDGRGFAGGWNPFVGDSTSRHWPASGLTWTVGQRVELAVVTSAQACPSTATVAAGTSPVTEGTDATFTVTLSHAAPSGGLTVNLTVSESAGSDYVAPGNEGPKTVSFAQGDTSKTYRVATVDDPTDEPDGSVTVTLASGTGYLLRTATSASVTVNDDDAPDTEPSFGDSGIANRSYTENTPIADLTLPAATGGNGTLRYGLSPAPPAGLSFDAETRRLTGTPAGTHAAATYTYTVTDADGDTATLTFTITVAAAPPGATPSFGASSIPDQSYRQNEGVAGLTLPAATGGNGTLRYSLSPSAPAGLDFNAATRRLTGTPTGTQDATTYTYTVTDADGDTATLTFTIAIEQTGNIDVPDDLPAEHRRVPRNVAVSTTGVVTWNLDTDTEADPGTSYLVEWIWDEQAPSGMNRESPYFGNGSLEESRCSGGSCEVRIEGFDAGRHYLVYVSTWARWANGLPAVVVRHTPAEGETLDLTGLPKDVAITGAGLVTWRAGSVEDDYYSVAWASGDSRLETSRSPGARGRDYRIVDLHTCVEQRCRFQIPSFDAERHWVAEVNSKGREQGAREPVRVRHAPGAPRVTVAAGPAVAEGTAAAFTVTLSEAVPAGGLVLRYTVSEDGDFVAASEEGAKTLGLAAGATGATLRVPTVGDGEDEPDGAVTVTLGDGVGYVLGSPTSASVTVRDGEGELPPPGTPVVTVTGGEAVTEGTAAAFTVSVSPAPGVALAVGVSVADAPGSDFVAPEEEGAKTVAIPAGQTSAPLAVPTVADPVDEPGGVVTVTLAPGEGYALGSPSSAVVTVRDDDGTDDDDETGDDDGARVPYLLSESALYGQGFVRVVNHSDEAGEVSITAIDDAGTSYGPLTLPLGAGAAAHFNSADLERGNSAKGIESGTGAGEGDWRLALASALDIEVLSYVRSAGGFVTSMHDEAPRTSTGEHRVVFMNPASNRSQVSGLRLVNPGEAAAEVRITGVDDAGESGAGAVELTLGAGVSRTVRVQALESGEGEGLSGALGDGQGKWRLRVSADRTIRVMSVLASPTGYLANVSTTPGRTPEARRVPYFLSESSLYGQGFVRVVNHSGEAGEVSITAIDDAGTSYGPLTLPLGAGAAAHFNSADLERGNSAKGIESGTGAGEGDWRLALASALDIEVLSYVRSAGGFVTSMHDEAPRTEAGEHRVVFMNPASNRNQVSGLRLVNPGEAAAEVRITGVDDAGESGAGAVVLTLGAGVSRTVRVQALESGEGEGLSGALGDGRGKWRLGVSADRPIRVMSVLANPTGHLVNVSTTPGRP